MLYCGRPVQNTHDHNSCYMASSFYPHGFGFGWESGWKKFNWLGVMWNRWCWTSHLRVEDLLLYSVKLICEIWKIVNWYSFMIGKFIIFSFSSVEKIDGFYMCCFILFAFACKQRVYKLFYFVFPLSTFQWLTSKGCAWKEQINPFLSLHLSLYLVQCHRA